MPEWLKLLLAAQGSMGFADTLHTLLGTVPQYQQMPNMFRGGGDVMAMAGFDRALNPTMSLTPEFSRQFNRRSQGTKRGEKFLAHEFGHLITGPGSKNPELGRMLIELDPENIQTEKGNEAFADDFQQAMEFLRSGGKRKVSKKARQIADVLIQFQPFTKVTATR